jgi:hypothetical protein
MEKRTATCWRAAVQLERVIKSGFDPGKNPMKSGGIKWWTSNGGHQMVDIKMEIFFSPNF